MRESTSTVTEVERLRGHAERAFTEVQRADAKATALCATAGGLLAVGIAVLTSTNDLPGPGFLSLVSMCLLSLFAMMAALLVLRPVVTGVGLQTELLAEAAVHLGPGVSTTTRAELERHGMERRLRVLSSLADRKLRAARLSVDFTLASLLMAGICLLSCFLID